MFTGITSWYIHTTRPEENLIVTNAKNYHVLYLTGAPATGKSTLMAALTAAVSPLIEFSYSKVLADYVSQRDARLYSQDDVRKHSADVILPADVSAADASLLALVNANRTSTHIVIDSHAVTKESYGFRVTPFALSHLREIRPTIIVVLYTEPSVVIDRIRRNHQGRPLPTSFEAMYHSDLQATVALIYSIQLGIPAIYFLNSASPVDQLTTEIARLMQQ